MTRPERKPHFVAFNLPVVRTLADMTAAERVAIMKRHGTTLTGYDAEGEPIGPTVHEQFDTSDS